MPNPERSSNRKAEELASASSNFQEQNCHYLDLGPTANEKKTSDDDELVVLENKSTAHNLNETS